MNATEYKKYTQGMNTIYLAWVGLAVFALLFGGSTFRGFFAGLTAILLVIIPFDIVGRTRHRSEKHDANS